jgi:large subunit ribosomal protein L6e
LSQVALGAKGKQTPKKAVKSGLPKIHSRFYAADDVAKPLPSRKAAQHPTVALKAGYAKGQVLILLAGRFRGKRVVFLGQTAAGLLLVCGA